MPLSEDPEREGLRSGLNCTILSDSMESAGSQEAFAAIGLSWGYWLHGTA
ncbi:hypothetical protein PHLCEN_2v11341 [Hermanssonia centrifuga]|uniref:Uncharacterized protein n=1 Tax=Hermanssonia centrifuga TaxID=98765 RepID=A0A2R6NKM0_9APHY|nr:hypothetical protein PHLCEN_2v11341 [Hermanssonia centrifuga]